MSHLPLQPQSDDAEFMALAAQVGQAAAASTGDNPAVGCVIVKAGTPVGQGATQPPGGPHAEVVAIEAAERAGHDIAECDLYVTLEPCAFQGRTPPCATFIAGKKPRRVVVALRDPHPRVRGRGIREMRAAGIEVVEGVLAEVVRRHLTWWLARFSDAGEFSGVSG